MSVVEETTRRIRCRRLALMWVVLGVATVVIVYAMPPQSGGYYPPCLYYTIVGWHCPGCGATRCLHALLHGRVAEAASYNVLFFLALPVIGVLVGRSLYRALAGRPSCTRPMPIWLIIVISLILIAFGVARNIEQPPFHRLAPGQLYSDVPR